MIQKSEPGSKSNRVEDFLILAVYVCAVLDALHHTIQLAASRLPTSRSGTGIERETQRVGNFVIERAEGTRGEGGAEVGEDG